MERKKIRRKISQSFLGTLVDSLLGNLLTGKGTIKAGEEAIRDDLDF